jgi:hypothetical protein
MRSLLEGRFFCSFLILNVFSGIEILSDIVFFLLIDHFETTWLVDRVIIDLTVQDDENSGGYGKDRQNQTQASQGRDELNQTPGDEPDCQ